MHSHMKTNARTLAIGILILAMAPAINPVRGQVRPSAEMKNPGKARTYSVLLPGAGHLYAGEKTKGAALAVVSAGALITGILTSDLVGYETPCGVGDCLAPGAHDFSARNAIIGAGVAGAVWLYAFVDAPRAAARTNRRNAMAEVRVIGGPMVVDGSIRPALSVRVLP